MIYHKIQDVIDTHTEVSVSKVHEVRFNVTDKILPTFTNAHRQQELGVYRIPVEFLHTQSGAKFTLVRVSPNVACSKEVNSSGEDVYIQQVPFECVLELKDGGNLLSVQKFIKAESYFDSKSGKSFCNLAPMEDRHAMETLSTISKLSLSLRVKASDSTQTYEVYSGHQSIPFVPAFSLSRKSIILTPSDAAVEITVTGLPKQLQALQVCVRDTDNYSSTERMMALGSLVPRPSPHARKKVNDEKQGSQGLALGTTSVTCVVKLFFHELTNDSCTKHDG